jgi:hypothetical protein
VPWLGELLHRDPISLPNQLLSLLAVATGFLGAITVALGEVDFWIVRKINQGG